MFSLFCGSFYFNIFRVVLLWENHFCFKKKSCQCCWVRLHHLHTDKWWLSLLRGKEDHAEIFVYFSYIIEFIFSLYTIIIGLLEPSVIHITICRAVISTSMAILTVMSFITSSWKWQMIHSLLLAKTLLPLWL